MKQAEIDRLLEGLKHRYGKDLYSYTAQAVDIIPALMTALHDTIQRPMGVVPESAERFYDQDRIAANVTPPALPPAAAQGGVDERSAFEAWAASHWPNMRMWPEAAWQGWQGRAALPLPASPELQGDGQDRKFAFRDGRFVNRVSGEAIPSEEPVMIFRARDHHALEVLREYLTMATDEHHRSAIRERMAEFAEFARQHPERMKEPGITHDIQLASEGSASPEPSAVKDTPPAAGMEERAREVARMREVAADWRRPALQVVEGPNDLKIYGGTIADDIDRWADMLAREVALPTGGGKAMREAAAKLVEGFFSPNASAENLYAEQIATEIRALALPTPQQATVEAGGATFDPAAFDPAAFGRKVRIAMLGRPFRTVADEAGVSPATLSRVARGHMPDVLTYFALRKWLAALTPTSAPAVEG